ncbi:MAG: radical SAM protein [Kiritimatiellae bacterium]|nr:radical SAM protein [Kiritimatiellia bacterium]
MKVAFVTYGCRLNRAEALDLEARFAAAGHLVVPLPATTEDAAIPDVIIVRGCSVTAKAQHDCEKDILKLQQRFPSAQVFPMGCLPGALKPDVLPFFLDATPAISTQTSRAYLKVQDGCSGKCAFCIVPQFRGLPVSEPFDVVLARARAFLDAGFRELVVTGCNLALYRSQGKGLADLLGALATLLHQARPPHRVRLGSLEPGICDDAILEAFARHNNICRFIHLSLQSGANRILQAMNRPYPVEKVASFCTTATRILGSHLTLGADVIAGFPGETEEDHRLTCAFLSSASSPDCRFSNLHVFPYSERPGTPAATMAGAVPREIRLQRAKELEEIGRRNKRDFAQRFLGGEVEVCVEKDGNGWTAEYLRCLLPPGLPRRSLVRVRVVAVKGDVLEGNLVSNTIDDDA